jgi:hypothetical protein
MRNMFYLTVAVLGVTFAADRAMAAGMDDLEVTIRVIEAGKEHTGDIGHKLELPAPPAHKVETHHTTGGDNRRKDEPREKDKSHEHHEADGESTDHHDNAKENHERAVDQYQDSQEERNNALEGREDLNEMLDGGDQEDTTSGETGSTDN